MNAPPTPHPSPEQLQAFGHGHLTAEQSDTILSHLEACPDCRRAVADLPADSLLRRLRAREQDATPGPDGSLGGLARSLTRPSEPPASPPPAVDGIPPELADNPEYEVVRELGRGGMGVVYLAKNRLMGRDEVLKVMGPAVMARPGAADRFLREIQSAARLGHTNIVRAFAARRMGELLVLAMEYVPGDDLGKLVKARGRLPVLNACVYAQQVASGLQHAHEHGMVHRDIKPANLILLRAGRKHTVKILDFGLAKLTSEAGVEAELTGTGQMMGTPHFMAPEQATDAARADIRADVYSLGCTLYYLLAGQTPFRGAVMEVVIQHRFEPARPLTEVRPDVPAELAAVVAKMMAKEPADRYQTPAEVAKALTPFIKPAAAPPAPAPAPAAPPAGADQYQKWVHEAVPEAAPIAPLPVPRAEANPVPAENGNWESILAPTMIGVDVPPMPTPAPPRPSPALRRRRLVWPVAVAGGLLVGLAGLWAAGAFKAKSKEGVIVIENMPPDADVEVDGEAVTVTRKGEQFRVNVTRDGTHRLRVTVGGKEFFARNVDVTLGGDPVSVRVERAVVAKPAPAKIPAADTPARPTAADVPEPPFQPLSGEKYWDRWHQLRFGQLGGWKYGPEELELQYRPQYSADNPVLATKRDDFQDFRVRFEVYLDGAQAFFGLRDQPTINTGNPAYPHTKGRGYAVLLADRIAEGGEPWAQHAAGSLFVVGGPPVPLGKVETLTGAGQDRWKRGEWNTVEVYARGNTVAVTVNGQGVAKYADKDVVSRYGRFSFTPTGGSTLRFRNFQVKELPPVRIEPPQTPTLLKPDPQFVALFNGKDAAGWKTHPQASTGWLVEAGLLTARGGPKSYLYTERGDYRNFHLRVEARLNEAGNSGIFFRSPFQAKAAGYQVEINQKPPRRGKFPTGTGSLLAYEPQEAALVEVPSRGQRSLPTWFTMEVVAAGNRVEIKLNGQSVAEHTVPADNRSDGHIALEHAGADTVVEFRTVEIKELPDPPSIKNVMEANHKGGDALFARVTSAVNGGRWADAQKDAKVLAENGAALGLGAPPKGDAKSWEALARKYAEATRAVRDAADQKAGEETKAALAVVGASCKDCHTAHRGK